MELPIQNVVGNGAALTTILGQSPALGPCPQGLQAHQALDAVQTTVMPQGQHVTPDTAGALSSVAAHKALTDQVPHQLVRSAALASGTAVPGIESASRDTERLAYQSDWPDSPVLHHEAELHIDSFAK